MTARSVKKIIIFPYFIPLSLMLFFLGFIIGIYTIKAFNKQNHLVDKASSQQLNEIAHIKQTENRAEQSRWYLKLIERIGPEKAQDELERAGLPATGNTHLLNHTAGNYIFKKYGSAGITKCKNYFASSCYHGIIINTLALGKVDDSIDIMLESCKKASRGIFSQCVHGFGHGILPWVGYGNLVDALVFCDNIQARVPEFSAFVCHTGVFMENIWGVHEGTPSPDRWIRADDPHYPCNDPRVAEVYRPACWYNQHSIMRKFFGNDMSKISNECSKVADKDSKKNCFEGLFNSIQVSSKTDVNTQFNACNQMPKEWVSPCLKAQLVVGIGHGDDKAPFEICSRITMSDKKQCYHTLNNLVVYYIPSNKRANWCNKIPEDFREEKCT